MRPATARKIERICCDRGSAGKVWSSAQYTLLLGITLVFVGVPAVHAEVSPQGGAPASLRVHGAVTISVEPDQARFDIGVVTQAATAKVARDQNTNQSNALVRKLTAAFPEAVIKVINVSVNPNYQYPREGPPTIAGYTASNTVRLLLNDVSKLQSVIDISIESGASSINRLSFAMRDENSARAQALAAAARQAQASAEALATSLKLKLTKLRVVEETQPVIFSPPRELSFEKLRSQSLAPVSPGTFDVHAEIDLSYDVTPIARRDISRQPGSETTSP